MCLKEKDFNLEGHLVLDVSSEQGDIFSFIKEIELFTSQRIFFTAFKMFLPERREVDERCCEQVQRVHFRRRVHFSTNMMALRFDQFKPPASLIEHITEELDGAVEFLKSYDALSNVQRVPSPKEQSVKDSSLQILRLVYIPNFIQDIETLVRLNHLPQLRVLDLQGSHRHCLGVFWVQVFLYLKNFP